jgi:DNA repair photolyase
MQKYSVLYEPKNRAGEYGDLALNLTIGCSHACEYCYAPRVMHKSPDVFFNQPVQRKDIFEKFYADVHKMVENNDKREVFLCFTCDPLQPICFENNLIQNVIQTLELNNIKYRLLTKGGYKEFYKIASYISPELCTVGSTLVFSMDQESKMHEPGAPITSERIELLKAAKFVGCKTWVSLEPVWSYYNTTELIALTAGFVDEYKIGMLNYHPHSKEIDWKMFAEMISIYCEDVGVNYVLKEDLAKLLR